MIYPSDSEVNHTYNVTSVKFKQSQYTSPAFLPLDQAIESAFASPEFHIGSQWYACAPDEVTAATPFRYWCVMDFDDKHDPAKALTEAFDFIVSQLKPLGLEAGSHYKIAVSGTKGCKLFFRYLPPASHDAPKVWHAYLTSMQQKWPTLDAQVAYQVTLRGPWSRHPKRPDRVQAVIEKGAGVLSTSPEWCLDQASNTDRPAFDVFRSSLPVLDDPPPAFLALWQTAQETWLKAELAKGPKRPRPSYGARGADIPGILDSNGISYREGQGMNGDRYFRLTRCIFCGARSKAAIKGRSMFYDCFRQTCAASSGLSFREWTSELEVPPRYSGKASGVYTRTLDLRSRKAVAPMPLLKARHKLFEEISAVVDSGKKETVLLSCTPGLGKTHTTLSVVCDRLHAKKMKAVIACQTKELAQELLSRSYEFSVPLTTKRVLLEGRNEDNCHFSRQVATIGALGWSPGKAFCAGCPYHGTCKYYRTVKDACDKQSLVFTTHEQAISFLDSDQMKASMVVFDEDPFRAIHSPFRVGIREIKKAVSLKWDMVVEAAHFLALVMGKANQMMPENGKLVLRGQALIDILSQSFAVAGSQTAPDWRSLCLGAAAYVDVAEPSGGCLAGASSAQIRAVTPKSFFWLLEELVREADRPSAKNSTTGLVVRSDGLVFWDLQMRSRPSSFMPNLILDAYGDPTLYERMLGVPITDVSVLSDLSRSSFFYVPVRTSRQSLSDFSSPAWKEMDRVMAELSKAGDVLVGTYLAFTDAVEKRYGCKTFHFGRGRGIDSFKECQSVVLFGVPQPPAPAIMDRACFFFQDDDTPLSDTIDEKNRRIYTDFRVQKALDSMRESEAAQVVHRVRPAVAPRTVVCIGMVDYPVLPTPSPFPRNKDSAHVDAMEQWVRSWFDEYGWFTPALIGEGVCPIPAIPSRKAGKLWKKIFGNRGVSLSPHPTLCARRVWGNREAAREWVRSTAKAQGIEYWEDL